MAINSIKFVISGSATATNGSDTITVTGNTDLRNVYSGSAVFLGTKQVVEAISGTAPDVNGNSTIKLRFPWADPTTTGKLVVFNTIEGLAEAIRRAREVVGQVGGSIEAFGTVLTATSETVTVSIGAENITVTPYGYLATQSEALILSLQNASDLFDGLEQDVANLTAAVAGQQGIINTNLAESNAAKAAAELAADDAEASKVEAQTSAAAALVSEVNAATSENNASASALSASNSEVAAATSESNAAASAANALASEQAALLSASSASGSKDAADQSAANAQTSEDNAAASAVIAEAAKAEAQDAQSIALANANFAGLWSNQTGSKSPPYSVRHEPFGESDAIWMLNNPVADIALSEPSVSNTDWFVIGLISGSTVTSVNGRDGAVTLTKSDVGLDNVDNTTDLNKPISTLVQSALDNKVDKVIGKQLSTEDYTTEEKTKLSSLGTAATANVTVGNTDTTPGRVLKVGDFGLGAKTDSTSLKLFGDFFTEKEGGVEHDIGMYAYGTGPVMHGYRAGGSKANPTALPAGSLIYGLGGRPFTGTAFTPHSTAAIHFISREDVTDTSQGSAYRVLITPLGGTAPSDRKVAYSLESDSVEEGVRFRVRANGDLKQRFAFQSDASYAQGFSGDHTSLSVLPRVTGGIAQINFFNSTDPSNSGYIGLRAHPDTFDIISGSTGDGVPKPVIFWSGNLPRLTLDPEGKLLSPNGSAFVGTVNNSGNSAIIQRGSNANGEFVRFADGTQICTTVKVDGDVVVPANSWVVLPEVTCPAPFTDVPLFIGISHTGSFSGDMVSATESPSTISYGTIRLIRNLSSLSKTITVKHNIVAIGRWY